MVGKAAGSMALLAWLLCCLLAARALETGDIYLDLAWQEVPAAPESLVTKLVDGFLEAPEEQGGGCDAFSSSCAPRSPPKGFFLLMNPNATGQSSSVPQDPMMFSSTGMSLPGVGASATRTSVGNQEGQGGYVEWPVEAQPFLSNNFTLEFWLYPMHGQGEIAGIAGNMYSSGLKHSGWEIFLTNEDCDNAECTFKLVFVVSDMSIQGRVEEILVKEPYVFIRNGVWTHMACTFDTVDGLAIHVNGDLKSQKSSYNGGGIDYSMPNNFRVGAYKDDEMGLRKFKGGVDEIRLWEGRLSRAQIMQRMSTRLTGLEDNLMGYWPLDEQEGFYALDLVSANCVQVAQSASEGTDGNCLSAVGIHGYLIESDNLEWRSSDWTESQAIAEGPTVFRLSENFGDNLFFEAHLKQCTSIWGYAPPLAMVELYFLGQVYTTQTSRAVTDDFPPEGQWSVCVGTGDVVGGPYKLFVRSGGASITLSNVMIGLIPSSCSDNNINLARNPRKCKEVWYPSVWFPRAIAYWGFTGCAKTSQGLAEQDVRITGFCDEIGILSEGWKFLPNQFMIVRKLRGIASSPLVSSSHSVAMWFLIHNITDGDIPLATLGNVRHPTIADLLSDPSQLSSAWDYQVPSADLSIWASFVTLRASSKLCRSSSDGGGHHLVFGILSSAQEDFYHCTGNPLQHGVWYHVVWSYDEGRSELNLWVNGFHRRRLQVSSEIDLGKGGGQGMSFMLARDPAARTVNSTWTVDEVFIMKGTMTSEDVKKLLEYPYSEYKSTELMQGSLLESYNLVYSLSGGRKSSVERPVKQDYISTGADVELFSSSFCSKRIPYFVDEELNPMGIGRCTTDCDCCGFRNCSEHGVCLGSADLQLNPDCLNVSHPPRTFPDLPTFPAEFLSSPATREQQAAMPPTSIPQFATKRLPPLPDRSIGPDPSYAQRLEGILDTAGYGILSNEKDVTSPQ